MMKKASVLTAVCLVLVATGSAISVPYEIDSHTLHLYHFDGDTLDSVATNPIHLALDSGATADRRVCSRDGTGALHLGRDGDDEREPAFRDGDPGEGRQQLRRRRRGFHV